jgi:hypothetical protein
MAMAATIELVPLTDHGRDLLAELERRTEQLPYKTDEKTGARTYWLSGDEAKVDDFDPVLEQIEPGWREHLTR